MELNALAKILEDVPDLLPLFDDDCIAAHISHDLSWSMKTTGTANEALQRVNFLRSLKEAKLPQHLPISFNRCTIESITTHCITACYSGFSSQDRKALIIMALKNISSQLPSLGEFHVTHCCCKAVDVCRDLPHPDHIIFTPLSSSRSYTALHAYTTRVKNSFYPRADKQRHIGPYSAQSPLKVEPLL